MKALCGVWANVSAKVKYFNILERDCNVQVLMGAPVSVNDLWI